MLNANRPGRKRDTGIYICRSRCQCTSLLHELKGVESVSLTDVEGTFKHRLSFFQFPFFKIWLHKRNLDVALVNMTHTKDFNTLRSNVELQHCTLAGSKVEGSISFDSFKISILSFPILSL